MGPATGRRFFLGLVILISIARLSLSEEMSEISPNEVQQWAKKFGENLYKLSVDTTHADEIRNNYKSAKLYSFDGQKMLDKIVQQIETMLTAKIQNIQRIVDVTQQAMTAHVYDENITFRYFNAKEINNREKFPNASEMILTENDRFYNYQVNTSHSTIHLATNVYKEDVLVLNAIKSSEDINPTFIANHQKDGTSLWQYFGSVTGFLRNYPGVKWMTEEGTTDIFDCRMRPWFREAAASPKDMVILLDTSGSMTGVKHEIARHVVFTLLDTLNANDFVAVYTFADKVVPVVPCFDGYLVPATSENVEEFKNSMKDIELNQIANFSLALAEGFDLLQNYTDAEEGSLCNQAIMIVTDGAPETYDEVFAKYNETNVRVFTYLIGREVTAVTEVLHMACTNKGYYTHVKTLAQIREQVEKYFSVMARPMVLQNKNSIIWTPVYADATDLGFCDEEDRNPRYCGYNTKPHQMMTTVAAPVFDLGNVTYEAILLGVAGTDIPIAQILDYTTPYQIGVNGYPFIITNNGHLLHHPDLRPMLGDMLKLDFSTVDLTEVEISDKDIEPWEEDPDAILLRQRMVDRERGEMNISVRFHYDNLNRIFTRTKRYFFKPIEQTPFSFGIALPKKYGLYRVKTKHDTKDNITKTLSELQSNRKWIVHPDWRYCTFRDSRRNVSETEDDSVESILLEVLSYVNEHDEPKTDKEKLRQVNSYISYKNCDDVLINDLLFDAKSTNTYAGKRPSPEDNEKYEKHGLVMRFVATRSGLTRWEDLLEDEEFGNITEFHFIHLHTRSIDEPWYKRAVDQYFINKDSFVFSVPFNAGNVSNDSLVTGAHSIFIEGVSGRTPVAVVGLQFKHSLFAESFMDMASTCSGDGSCSANCSSEDLDCYILDDDGFVIVSKDYEQTGKFFGEVDGSVMESLLTEGIYSSIRLYDSQGICSEVVIVSAASFLLRPFEPVTSFFTWLFKKIVLFWVEYNIYSLWNYDWLVFASSHKEHEPEVEPETKIVFSSCFHNLTRYRLDSQQLRETSTELKMEYYCNRSYTIQEIPHTNLVLLAVDATWPCPYSPVIAIAPAKVDLNETVRCEMMRTVLPRRRPVECYRYTSEEIEVKDCGRGATLQVSIYLISISLFLSALVGPRWRNV